jgi:hypothetical protein
MTRPSLIATIEPASFAECLTILHSVKLLPSVTLVKYFIDKEFLPNTFFEHSAKTLPSVEKHSTNKSTHQIKYRKKPQKINYGNNSPTTTHYHINRLIIFTIIFNQTYMFCEWFNHPIIFCYYFKSRFELETSLTRILSSTTTLLHQLYLYYVFIPHVL